MDSSSQNDSSLSTQIVPLTEAQKMLESFWRRELHSVHQTTHNDFRTQELPLARIKKIMKLDEDVKMISGEAPVLFAKAVEMFIAELTLRAWLNTEDNKRRTLQRNDIAMAISKYDQFDFLIDIVPREEAKPMKRNEVANSSVITQDQLNYLIQQQISSGSSQQLQLIQPNQSFALQPQVFQVPTSRSNQDRLTPSNVVPLNATTESTTNSGEEKTNMSTPIIFSSVYNNNGEIVQQIPLTLSPQQYQTIIQGQNSSQNQPIIINPQTLPVSTQYITNSGQVVQAIIPQTSSNKIVPQNNS